MSYTPVNPYISLTELVEELKQKPADVAINATLTDELLRAIDRASRWVDEYTRRDYIYRDFRETPIQFDQFSDSVMGAEIFFPYLPLLELTSLTLGKFDESNVTTLEANVDYFADQKRIHILPSSRSLTFNPEVPRDGNYSRVTGGWNLFRPDRVLFMRGRAGFIQPLLYSMTSAGDTGTQTSAWQISAYTAPATTLYWRIVKVDDTTTIGVYGDAAFTQLLASGSTTDTGAQTIALSEQNSSGIAGRVSFSYTADDTDAGNTLTVTPSTPTPIDTSRIPLGLEGRITTATRLVAAAFSGHNRKEVMGLDGSKNTVIMSEIPKTVYQLLGKRMPLLV